MKVLLCVSLVVAAVIKSECHRKVEEDVNSSRITGLAAYTLQRMNNLDQMQRRLRRIMQAETEHGSMESLSLTMEVCPEYSQSERGCEVCYVHLYRDYLWNFYSLNPNYKCYDTGRNGSSRSITKNGIFYLTTALVLSQIHRILSLF